MPQPYFRILFVPLLLLLSQCTSTPPAEVSWALSAQLADTEQLPGRAEYLNSPFVTAGDRVYLVGHQNGQFPDLGWHVAGEMGGLWDHPIKLLDGFTATVTEQDQAYCLAAADSFINYPFANRHVYARAVPGVRVERFQFVPDAQEALAIEYMLTNTSDTARVLSLEFAAYSDLRPVWLGGRTGLVDHPDTAFWHLTDQRWVIKDTGNPWYVTFGSPLPVAEHTVAPGHCPYDPAGSGVATTLRFDLDVPAQSTVRVPITVVGSYVSEAQAQATYARVQNATDSLLHQKQGRYRTLAQQTKLTVPDQELQQAFRWVKYNTDWLVRDVPEQGRGLSAGLPDYPWWFGVNNAYALQGALAVGQWDIVYSTIDLVHRLSEVTNGNGRVMHEASTNGAVFNPGNVNETPQFASLIRAVYQWTGDQAFLEKYYPFVVQGLDWLWRENDADGNGLPDGFGMMEIHGLDTEMIDVAAYSQRALVNAAAMARTLGDSTQANAYQQRAERLKQTINTQFWVPAYGSYADFIGTAPQAQYLLADALERADSLEQTLGGGGVADYPAATAGQPTGGEARLRAPPQLGGKHADGDGHCRRSPGPCRPGNRSPLHQSLRDVRHRHRPRCVGRRRRGLIRAGEENLFVHRGSNDAAHRGAGHRREQLRPSRPGARLPATDDPQLRLRPARLHLRGVARLRHGDPGLERV